MKLEKARALARALIEALRPACDRIEVGGSIRREKAAVKDIEIVYIPRIRQVVVDLFGSTASFALMDDALARLIADGILVKDEETKRWGPKYKRLIHAETGMVVELFAATEENWGLIYALRTGPAEFNHLLVSSAAIGGAMPLNMRMRDGQLWHQGLELVTPTEEAFFEALGLPCWPPAQRDVKRLRAHLQGEE